MIGLVLILTGLLIRLVSMRHLKGMFSLNLRTPEVIVTTGLYRYVRHPSYIGSLLMILGVSLIHPVLGITYLAFIFYMARVVEEEMLLRKHSEYLGYSRNVNMFIPRLRRK